MKRKFFILILSILSGSLAAESGLDRLIQPEIKNDELYQAIYELSRNESIKTILEIGSSSGDGSTEAFVRGASENPCHPTLFCIEISKTRFAALKNRYAHLPYVKCYRVSSVPLNEFPKLEQFTGLLRDWLKQDIDYVNSSGVPQDGIRLIKKENNIENFDMVLIDGSEFTGIPEFSIIYGAKFILLDDITGYKNRDNNAQLFCDPDYQLIVQDIGLRNGYAIYKRIDR